MGVSIYYSARRAQPLTPDEQMAIHAIVARYLLETLIKECGLAEDEYDGESFCVYPTDHATVPGVVFEGATKLPLCSEGAFWSATQYWCCLLSEIRHVLLGADWHVHIDDLEIPWNEESRAFDPSSG